MDIKTEHLINEATIAFRRGELSALAAMIAIDSFLFPKSISKEDIAWARENLDLSAVKSDLKRVDAIKDSDIDFSDMPATDEKFWQGAQVITPTPISGSKQLDASVER